MKALGTQHIAEFIGCTPDKLNDELLLKQILTDSINESGLHYVDIISHKFSPVGVTVLAIISESHVGIHTYPEAGQISLDIFTCSDSVKQLKLLDILRDRFNPDTVRVAEVIRGNPIEYNDSEWIISATGYGFEVRYHIKEKVFSGKSEFQKINIIENENFGRMLFLDNDLQAATRDVELYNSALVSPVSSKEKINSALVLGGGDGGVLNRLLKLGAKNVTLVEIDKEVIELSQKYLSCICEDAFNNPATELVYKNAIEFIKEDNSYDVIISDLTMNPGAFTNQPHNIFLDELFTMVASRLTDDGIFSLQIGSVNDSSILTMVNELLGKNFTFIKYHDEFIPSFCEKWMFASVKK